MSADGADGVRHLTRAQWDALAERCARVLAESAQVRGEARRARSEAGEQRVRSDDRLERDAAAAASLR